MNKPTLEEYRSEIDRIDRDLAKLLFERLSVARHIGVLKKEAHLPIEDKNREEALLKDRASVLESLGVERAYSDAFYGMLLSLSKKMQRETTGSV